MSTLLLAQVRTLSAVACAALILLASSPRLSLAQPTNCAQPAATGCALPLNQPVTAVLANPDDVHTWQISLNRSGPLRISLTRLPADFDVHVYTADGVLLGESTNDGTQDDIVELASVEAGAYVVYVNSARGEMSTEAYTLRAEAPGASGPAPTAARGAVLLADSFADPSVGWLPTTSVDTVTSRGYVNGEYQIAKLDPTQSRWNIAFAPGDYVDVSVSADARTLAAGLFTEASIDCRNQPPNAFYEVRVRPESRTVGIIRDDNGSITVLVPDAPTAAIVRGQPLHIELNCVGSTISASVNGQGVGPVQDTTYSHGRVGIKAGGPSNMPADVRFKNLVISQG